MEIAAHRVHYDFRRRLWYADIEIEAGPSYVPFVRLALVRVQPHALADCALSAVVHTQYAQLLPTRELHLDRAEQHLRAAGLRTGAGVWIGLGARRTRRPLRC